MNELVYLTEDEFDALTRVAFSLYVSDWRDGAGYENYLSAMCKLMEAKNNGLLVSFDVKKAKVRRVRR